MHPPLSRSDARRMPQCPIQHRSAALPAIGLLCLALIAPPALAMTAVDDPGAPPPETAGTPAPAHPAARATAPLRDTVKGIIDKTRAPVQDRQPQRNAHPHTTPADEPTDAPN